MHLEQASDVNGLCHYLTQSTSYSAITLDPLDMTTAMMKIVMMLFGDDYVSNVNDDELAISPPALISQSVMFILMAAVQKNVSKRLQNRNCDFDGTQLTVHLV